MITIKYVPREQIRNNGVGDYFYDGDNLTILVVDTGNVIYNEAIALHELIEAQITNHRGIKETDIDKFDAWFLSKGLEGEPGDFGPYIKEHRFAENIERQYIHELNIDWKEYCYKIDNLDA